MFEHGRPSEKEALEMILLYFQVTEPERRRKLFELAEQYAKECGLTLVRDPKSEKGS
jgi:hypothetical protein